MKRLTYNLFGLLLIASVVLFTACGGGGGGGGHTQSSNQNNNKDLTVDAVDNMGSSVANAIPGCVYTSDKRGIMIPDSGESFVAYKSVVDIVNQVKSKVKSRAKNTSHSINGPCGGKLTITNTHLNGSDDGSYTFANFCIESGENGGQAVANGVAKMHVDGKPSPNGPVKNYTTISTGKSGVSLKGTINGESKDYLVYINDAKMLHDGSGAISAKEIKVVNDGKPFRVTNLEGITGKGSGDDRYAQIKKATYHDVKEGAIDISTSKISKKGSATITAIRGSKKVDFVSDDISTGVFRSNAGGMDCSKLLNK